MQQLILTLMSVCAVRQSLQWRQLCWLLGQPQLRHDVPGSCWHCSEQVLVSHEPPDPQDVLKVHDNVVIVI